MNPVLALTDCMQHVMLQENTRITVYFLVSSLHEVYSSEWQATKPNKIAALLNLWDMDVVFYSIYELPSLVTSNIVYIQIKLYVKLPEFFPPEVYDTNNKGMKREYNTSIS